MSATLLMTPICPRDSTAVAFGCDKDVSTTCLVSLAGNSEVLLSIEQLNLWVYFSQIMQQVI